MTYDVTQINNELDLLEIRMEILDPYVDYFVIGESPQTFSGNEKPLYFIDNRKRFEKWEHKIIHHVSPSVETDDVFERTALQKDSIREKLKDCRPDDVIYYGDVDEIWIPIVPNDYDVYKFEQLNYCYYFNNRSSEVWQGTNCCKYKNLVNLNELRADHSFVVYGGWHLSNMGGSEQVMKKLEDYDHQEFNSDEIKRSIAEKIALNEDYVGRRHDWQGKPFHFWTDDSELPKYLLDNREKYAKYFK